MSEQRKPVAWYDGSVNPFGKGVTYLTISFAGPESYVVGVYKSEGPNWTGKGTKET